MKGLILFCIISLFAFCAIAQEESDAIYQGKRYINFNIKSLNTYNTRVKDQQSRLLKKLKGKEQRYANKLKRKDSAAYARYRNEPLSFDSISKLQKRDTGIAYRRIAGRANGSVDSLKKIESFLKDKIHLQGSNGSDLPAYDDKLAKIKGQANYNSYINDLIGQRTGNLRNISSSAKISKGAFKGIDKDVFYAKAKIKAFKNINDEPSKLEDMALETLQGQEGFEKYMGDNDPNGLQAMAGKGASSADLEKMGYQTKKSMNDQLQKKFGNNIGGIQQGMGKQVQEYQDQLKKLQSAKASAQQTKNSIKSLHVDKPSFKVNPMRGLPLSKRIEKQLNWQTTRTTLDGQPAMFQFAGMAGFKHTPKLNYGLGIATSIGLGTSWNNVHPSFQGLGLRSYATWKVLYGISGYAGYERMYKQAAFFDSKAQSIQTTDNNLHNTHIYNESVLIGLSKTYKVSDKLNGSMQVLYDVWWKEKGLKSPIVLRIATLKN